MIRRVFSGSAVRLYPRGPKPKINAVDLTREAMPLPVTPFESSSKTKNKSDDVRHAPRLENVLSRKRILPANMYRQIDARLEMMEKEEERNQQSETEVDMRPAWKIARDRLKAQGVDRWNPKNKLTRDQMETLCYLHEQNPREYPLDRLAAMYHVSREAVRRICKSNFQPDEVVELRQRLKQMDLQHQQRNGGHPMHRKRIESLIEQIRRDLDAAARNDPNKNSKHRFYIRSDKSVATSK